MCLLIIAHQIVPAYPLVVAANRDEFHNRPTRTAQFWQQQPDLLAGQDLEQGGTWMGITRSGRFAAVTNFRDPARTGPAPRSRGELPVRFLAGTEHPRQYLQSLAAMDNEYAGYNLLVGERDSLWYYTNKGAMPVPMALPPGVYGLSNAQLDTPWPKVELGKTKMQDLMTSGDIAHPDLAAIVADRRPAAAAALRLQGMESEMEQLLSAQFITTESYGTRSTTSVWRDALGHISWREVSFDAQGKNTATREFEFALE